MESKNVMAWKERERRSKQGQDEPLWSGLFFFNHRTAEAGYTEWACTHYDKTAENWEHPGDR